MKKAFLIAALVLGNFLFKTAMAQLPVSFKINITDQPSWGPVGYDHVEYYYIPGIDAFYYVPKRQYIYQQQGRWMFTPALPVRLRNFDLDRGYKVVINDPKPYRNAASYRTKYASYKSNHNQKIIRNSSDAKYFVNKGHPQHSKSKIVRKKS